MTRGSAIAERTARRSVSVEILAYCGMNNANRSHDSLRSTFSNCHIYSATWIVFTFVHVSLHKAQLSHS